MSTSQRPERPNNNEFQIVPGGGNGPPTHPPITKSNGDDDDGKRLSQHIITMVATSQRLPDFGLIKAEISADRREAEVVEKTDLLKLRTSIMEDVRPFIDLMKKHHPDE